MRISRNIFCYAENTNNSSSQYTFARAPTNEDATFTPQVKGKDEPIAVFEPLNAGAVLRTKSAKNNFLDRGDHADHLQVGNTDSAPLN